MLKGEKKRHFVFTCYWQTSNYLKIILDLMEICAQTRYQIAEIGGRAEGIMMRSFRLVSFCSPPAHPTWSWSTHTFPGCVCVFADPTECPFSQHFCQWEFQNRDISHWCSSSQAGSAGTITAQTVIRATTKSCPLQELWPPLLIIYFRVSERAESWENPRFAHICQFPCACY